MATEEAPSQKNVRSWSRERGESLLDDRDEGGRLKKERIFISGWSGHTLDML